MSICVVYKGGWDGGYGAYGGYNGDPLPNGDCLFNMVAYLLDGNTDDAQCYKDELMNQYTFTETTLENGLPAYSYDPDDVASYMSSYSSGYHISYGDLPNASDIQSVLNKDGGKVGVSYNGHNFVVKEVDPDNGQVRLFDPSNPGNQDIYVSSSALYGVYNFYRD